jgi:hypothetical protein
MKEEPSDPFFLRAINSKKTKSKRKREQSACSAAVGNNRTQNKHKKPTQP